MQQQRLLVSDDLHLQLHVALIHLSWSFSRSKVPFSAQCRSVCSSGAVSCNITISQEIPISFKPRSSNKLLRAFSVGVDFGVCVSASDSVFFSHTIFLATFAVSQYHQWLNTSYITLTTKFPFGPWHARSRIPRSRIADRWPWQQKQHHKDSGCDLTEASRTIENWIEKAILSTHQSLIVDRKENKSCKLYFISYG